MSWQTPVRRFGGLLAGLSLLAVAAALLLYGLGLAQERAIQLGVGALITGLVGSMLLLVAADRLPPGGPPTAP